MLNVQPNLATARKKDRYQVSIARTEQEVREAQRLRYQVFFEEMGASPDGKTTFTERDVDQYDADCEHLTASCGRKPPCDAEVITQTASSTWRV
jgi:putative hemolysin